MQSLFLKLTAVALLAVLLAACDACGDFNPLRSESHACRQQPPQR